MNSTEISSLQFYTTVWNTFVIPSICVLGMITNLLSIYIFIKLKVADPTFKLMLINSSFNLAYLFMCSFSFIFRCTFLCSFSASYVTKLYQLYIFLYLTSSFAIMVSFVELLNTVQRYFTMRNMLFFKRFPIWLAVLIIFVFCILIYVPVLLDYEIGRKNSIAYVIQKTNFSSTIGSQILSISTSVLRGPIVLVLISISNVLTIIEFKKIMSKKKLMIKGLIEHSSNNSAKNTQRKSELNMTQLVITSCMLYIICNLPNSVSFILSTLKLNNTVFFQYFVTFSNTVLFLYHGLTFFIYFFFNKKFKMCLKTELSKCAFKCNILKGLTYRK
jgi:hypothetical protein